MTRDNHVSEACYANSLHTRREALPNEQSWVPVYYLFDAEGNLKARAADEFGVTVLKRPLEKMFAATAEAATAYAMPDRQHACPIVGKLVFNRAHSLPVVFLL